MKRNLLALFAVAIAISLSAFVAPNRTVQNSTKEYFGATPKFYELKSPSLDQTVFGNYNDLGTDDPGDCPFEAKLCIIRVVDSDNDNDIDATDFASAFTSYDNHYGGTVANTLDDETQNLGAFLYKKN